MPNSKSMITVLGVCFFSFVLFACSSTEVFVVDQKKPNKQITQAETGEYVYCDQDCPSPTPKVAINVAEMNHVITDQIIQTETASNVNSEPNLVLASVKTSVSDVPQQEIQQSENLGKSELGAEPMDQSASTANDPQYVVFFNYGYSKLDKQGKETVKDAVVARKQQSLTKYELTGRTDDVGTQKKNERLAQARVDQVKKQITKLDGNAIVISSKTQAHVLSPIETPLPDHIKTKQDVPTDLAGQSRRVDIVLK